MRFIPGGTFQRDIGDGRTSVFAKVKAGLLPPAVRINGRRHWLESERDAIVAARARGASDDEMRALTKQLIVVRASL